jgi:hypothetical protein
VGRPRDKQEGNRSEHLEVEKILAYIADKLEGEEAYEADSHLAECRGCRERAHRFFELRTDFARLWDSWSVTNIKAETLQARLIEGIGAAGITKALRARAEEWIKNISHRTEAALDVTLSSTERAARVVQSGLKGMFQPSSFLIFSSVESAVRLWGGSGRNTIAVETVDAPWVRVTVDPEAGRVAVQAELTPEPWPLVALVPNEKRGAYIQEFSRPEGADYLLAEFDDIEDGNYLLLMETASQLP